MILLGKAPLAIAYLCADSLITNDDGTVTVKLLNGKHLSVNPDGTYGESDNNGAYERAKQTPRGLVYWSTYQDPKSHEWAGGWLIPVETTYPNEASAPGGHATATTTSAPASTVSGGGAGLGDQKPTAPVDHGRR